MLLRRGNIAGAPMASEPPISTDWTGKRDAILAKKRRWRENNLHATHLGPPRRANGAVNGNKQRTPDCDAIARDAARGVRGDADGPRRRGWMGGGVVGREAVFTPSQAIREHRRRWLQARSKTWSGIMVVVSMITASSAAVSGEAVRLRSRSSRS